MILQFTNEKENRNIAIYGKTLDFMYVCCGKRCRIKVTVTKMVICVIQSHVHIGVSLQTQSQIRSTTLK